MDRFIYRQLHRMMMLDYDDCFLELDSDPKVRSKKYEEWVMKDIPAGELELIRQSVQRGQLTGGRHFIDEIEQKSNRRVESRGQGRPRNVNLSGSGSGSTSIHSPS